MGSPGPVPAGSHPVMHTECTQAGRDPIMRDCCRAANWQVGELVNWWAPWGSNPQPAD